MEGSLGESMLLLQTEESSSLNPCSNGRYSWRVGPMSSGKTQIGLNPCSNGRYSRSLYYLCNS